MDNAENGGKSREVCNLVHPPEQQIPRGIQFRGEDLVQNILISLALRKHMSHITGCFAHQQKRFDIQITVLVARLVRMLENPFRSSISYTRDTMQLKRNLVTSIDLRGIIARKCQKTRIRSQNSCPNPTFPPHHLLNINNSFHRTSPP